MKLKLKPLSELSPKLFIALARAALYTSRQLGVEVKLEQKTTRTVWKYRSWMMDDMKKSEYPQDIRQSIQVDFDYQNLNEAWDDLRNAIGQLDIPKMRMIDLYLIAEACGSPLFIRPDNQRSSLTLEELLKRGRIQPNSEDSINLSGPLIFKIIHEEVASTRTPHNADNLVEELRLVKAKLKETEHTLKESEESSLEQVKRLAGEKMNLHSLIEKKNVKLEEYEKALRVAEKEQQDLEDTCASYIQDLSRLKHMFKAVIDAA